MSRGTRKGSNMRRELIGKVLSKMGKLSDIDIDEILFEQAVTRKRFGDIAIGLGLCEPEDLCDAWCKQIEESGRRIDLHAIGIDPEAARCLAPDIARRLGVIPIRVLGSSVVLAASRALQEP